jgi:hypothetical protein
VLLWRCGGPVFRQSRALIVASIGAPRACLSITSKIVWSPIRCSAMLETLALVSARLPRIILRKQRGKDELNDALHLTRLTFKFLVRQLAPLAVELLCKRSFGLRALAVQPAVAFARGLWSVFVPTR